MACGCTRQIASSRASHAPRSSPSTGTHRRGLQRKSSTPQPAAPNASPRRSRGVKRSRRAAGRGRDAVSTVGCTGTCRPTAHSHAPSWALRAPSWAPKAPAARAARVARAPATRCRSARPATDAVPQITCRVTAQRPRAAVAPEPAADQQLATYAVVPATSRVHALISRSRCASTAAFTGTPPRVVNSRVALMARRASASRQASASTKSAGLRTGES